MSVLYPVAASAEEALNRPRARAARQREAALAAGDVVTFVSEPAGPAFATREAALDAYGGRLTDDRPGKPAVAPEDRWCALSELSVVRPEPLKPVFKDGRRWPAPPQTSATVWRLQVSYWRIGAAVLEEPLDQARALRREREAADLRPAALKALAHQPLRPMRPQQPLDTGLFEVRPPEAPHILMPDE
jgi:hypothetical protein